MRSLRVAWLLPWPRLARLVALSSFRRRLVLSAAGLSAAIAIGLILAVQLSLAGSAVDSVDRLLGDRADALVGSIASATRSTTPSVPSSAIDPGVAVYDADGMLVAGFVSPQQAGAFEALSRTTTQRTRRVGDAYAVLGRPFSTASGASGVVVLSERLAPYEDDEHDALEISIVAGVVLFLVATGLASWASRRALAPVAQMARTAESWSEHDLERRFWLGPPTNEITALGQTLDGLLEKVERAIVAEQRLTSELAHELRTPLTAVQGTAELVAMRTDLDPELREDVADIIEACRHMAATVASLLELARAQSSARTEESCSVAAVLDALRASLDHRAHLSVSTDPTLRIAMPTDLVVRAISPVVDNAVRHADNVSIAAHLRGTRVVVSVSDDGPGVDVADAERIFRAGQTTAGGSGLGLALARRIARSAGGDVALGQGVPATSSGAVFDIALPAATHPART